MIKRRLIKIESFALKTEDNCLWLYSFNVYSTWVVGTDNNELASPRAGAKNKKEHIVTD